MRRSIQRASMWIAIVAALVSPAAACTGIQLTAKDGAVIHARTMEFGIDIPPSVVVVPRGTELVGMTPDNKPGKKWTAKYAALGLGVAGNEFIVDGLNAAGLATGLFYHPGYAKYREMQPGEEGETIAPMQFATYLLTNFATVAEVRQGLGDLIVAPVVFDGLHGVPPIHAIVHDGTGDCIVIEFLDGKTTIFDNPIGVITNSPTFDWHMTNLRNYVNLSVTNVPPIDAKDLKVDAFGEGSGLLGLPGDYTPPSRFVRAVTYSQAANQAATAEEGILVALHILNNFDIVKGVVRQPNDGSVVDEYTQWTGAADLKNGRYYYRTYADPKIRVVDLKKLKPSGSKILQMPVDDVTPTFDDVTSQVGE